VGDDRDAFNELRARELDLGIDPGPNPDRVQPGYALTARFSNIFAEDKRRRETFYLCVFELTNLSGGTILWSGSYEVKKAAVKGFLDCFFSRRWTPMNADKDKHNA
jgi:hypothetical protein